MGGGWKEVEPAHLTLVEEAHVGDAGVVGDFEGSWSLWSWGFSILVQEWRESETAERKVYGCADTFSPLINNLPSSPLFKTRDGSLKPPTIRL